MISKRGTHVALWLAALLLATACTPFPLGEETRDSEYMVLEREIRDQQRDPLHEELQDRDPIATMTQEGVVPVADALRLGLMKNSPYTVRGRLYEPLSLEEAWNYEETGIARWYGPELSLGKKKGRKGRTSKPTTTSYGEEFEPMAMTAAHRLLPLPINVEVTNLENNRSVVVRVNDRGPFPSKNDPRSNLYIIDVSQAAAMALGFYEKGSTHVRIRTVPLFDVQDVGGEE